jgi:glycosyltransferase involved in cell wall biosynthesis
MITVAHLITGLETGGAERMLARLVGRTDRARFNSIVISMTGPGTMGATIAASGVALHSLDMRRGIPDPRVLIRLRRILRQHRPAVLQTWLYHADLLGLVACCLRQVPHVVWGVHCTESTGTDAVRRILAWCSGWPDAVVVASEAGRLFHQSLGYHPRRWFHIPNGFDTTVLHPNPEQRQKLRTQFGWSDSDIVIALPARYHPQKDHATFVSAAARLAARLPNASFVLIGSGSEPDNAALAAMISERQLGERMWLLGERSDLDALYPAFDVVTLSSSFGESFPMVIGEAMSCGVPCIATDVGDTAELIGDRDAVVPPRDPAALAAAWERFALLSPAERAACGAAARARIVECYALAGIAARYEALYEEIAGAGADRDALY